MSTIGRTILTSVALTLAVSCSRARNDAKADASADAIVHADARAGADANADADADAGADADADASGARGFGTKTLAPRPSCAGEVGKHVAEIDARTSFVSGDDLLALVNRSPTGGLPPSYAPSDLVDLARHEPRSAAACEREPCLRRDAALALDDVLAWMKREGFPGKVESAFRSFGFQCGTFENWVKKSKRKTTEAAFCDVSEQSALPGHSQHQLGTTVDLFTEEWAKDERGVFREGFGCTAAGKLLRERAWEHGFVLPYPIHPDDRHPKQSCTARWDIHVDINPKTGYRYEHWHLRYVGKDAAKRFHDAWEKSGPGTPDELTLEQWLRRERGGLVGDAELPVCDGCNCGACATLASVGTSVCEMGKGARGAVLHLGEDGLPLTAEREPSIVRAQVTKRKKATFVEVVIDVPPGTLTQPPITGRDGASYATGGTYEALSPYEGTQPRAFPPLAGAWVVGISPESNADYPYRAALTDTSLGRVYNRADVRLPTRPGTITIRVEVPPTPTTWNVALLESGTVKSGPLLVGREP